MVFSLNVPYICDPERDINNASLLRQGDSCRNNWVTPHCGFIEDLTFVGFLHKTLRRAAFLGHVILLTAMVFSSSIMDGASDSARRASREQLSEITESHHRPVEVLHQLQPIIFSSQSASRTQKTILGVSREDRTLRTAEKDFSSSVPQRRCGSWPP